MGMMDEPLQINQNEQILGLACMIGGLATLDAALMVIEKNFSNKLKKPTKYPKEIESSKVEKHEIIAEYAFKHHEPATKQLTFLTDLFCPDFCSRIEQGSKRWYA